MYLGSQQDCSPQKTIGLLDLLKPFTCWLIIENLIQTMVKFSCIVEFNACQRCSSISSTLLPFTTYYYFVQAAVCC